MEASGSAMPQGPAGPRRPQAAVFHLIPGTTGLRHGDGVALCEGQETGEKEDASYL